MLEREQLYEQNPKISLNFTSNIRSFDHLGLKLGLQDYDSLLVFLLQQQFFISFFNLTQECDRLRLQKRTKFLAKTYFDISATQLTRINVDNAPLYLLTSISLAVKFNESRVLSDYVSVQSLVEASEGRFQHGEFIEAELQMLKLLKFKLHFVSPYEHHHKWSAFVAKYPVKKVQARLAKVEIIIDFALTLPSLMLLPSEELYLACFLMIFDGALERGDLDMIMRSMHDGAVVSQIRREVEMRLSEMGGSSPTHKN